MQGRIRKELERLDELDAYGLVTVRLYVFWKWVVWKHSRVPVPRKIAWVTLLALLLLKALIPAVGLAQNLVVIGAAYSLGVAYAVVTRRHEVRYLGSRQF